MLALKGATATVRTEKASTSPAARESWPGALSVQDGLSWKSLPTDIPAGSARQRRSDAGLGTAFCPFIRPRSGMATRPDDLPQNMLCPLQTTVCSATGSDAEVRYNAKPFGLARPAAAS